MFINPPTLAAAQSTVQMHMVGLQTLRYLTVSHNQLMFSIYLHLSQICSLALCAGGANEYVLINKKMLRWCSEPKKEQNVLGGLFIVHQRLAFLCRCILCH